MSRRPLAIGDRVRVYDIDQCDGRGCSDKGTVTGVSSGGVFVKCDHWASASPEGHWYLERQCVRLRKREPKPAEERVERWLFISDHAPGAITYETREQAIGKLCAEAEAERTGSTVRLLEVRSWEIPISKADLAREWDKRVAGTTVRTAECGPHFEWFCKALGFDAGKGE